MRSRFRLYFFAYTHEHSAAQLGLDLKAIFLKRWYEIQFLSVPLMIWMVFRCTLPFKTIHFDLWPVDFLPTPLALSLTDWPTKVWIIKALTPSIVRKFVIQPWLFSQLSALLSACSLSRRFHELPYSIEFSWIWI